MRKFQLLVRETGRTDQQTFRNRILEECLPVLERIKPEGLKLSITDLPLPRLTVLPLRKDNLALISVWTVNNGIPDIWQQGRLSADLMISGYRVEESTPVAYERHWQDGQTSPGVVLLTLLRQNKKLSYEAFMHEWHGRHTPKALRIHPFWNYIRNVIQETIIPGSPAFEGIVEEHFRTRTDCLNPVRMFGGSLKFIPNMIEVGLHANHFLDLKTTENYLMSEIWVKS